MRTATTLGRSHKGDWSLLSGPDVPITEQLAEFRQLLVERSHPKFSVVRLQESDGVMREHRLRSPEEHEAHEKQQAADHAAYVAASKPKPAKPAKPTEASEKKTENSK